jgi:hypothetical protein
MSSQLLRALTTWAGHLTPGLERKTTFVDGELELELTLRVRRHAPHESILNYRAAALEQLGGEQHWLVRHCGCTTQRKGYFSRHKADCRGAVVAAVVFRGFLTEQPRFLFVCSRHRERHGVEAKTVLAVVELPARELAELRRRSDVEKAKWDAKCRAEDEARERAERTVAP